MRLAPLDVFLWSTGFFALAGACGHSADTNPQPPAGTGGAPVAAGGISNSSGGPGSGGTAGGAPGTAGKTSEQTLGGNTFAGSGGVGGADAKMACGDGGNFPEDKTRPGYTAARNPEVATLLSRMTLEDKIKQLYGIPDPGSRDGGVYRDIERSEDAPSGTGKTVRGYRYRDAGRGLNLVAGQHDRASQGKDTATVFPVQSARAASWDVDLEFRVGVAIGDETMASKNTMMLAPCMNIIRHPFWGRTQETYSEDMHHTGRMASALTAGIQQHVVACPKHYAANNIENNRDNQNAEMNEQTLREVYASHFDMVVREGGAGCIMASYNLINGVKSTQNKHLLNEILKAPVEQGGMGYRGVVLTDWWAMPGAQGPIDTATAQRQAEEAIKAGLDIEVPWALNFSHLGALVESNRLTTADIDAAAGRVLEQKFRFGHVYTDQPYGLGTAKTTLVGDSIGSNGDHIALAEEAEIKSAVLLTNGPDNEPVLPIKTAKSIAVVGLDVPVTVSPSTELPQTGPTMRFAIDVNTGDRGSSRVNHDAAQSIGPFDGIKAAAEPKGITVTSGNSAAAAAAADFVVVIVGLTAGDEGEEYSVVHRGDRSSLNLPNNQNEFVSSVLDLGKPTAIIIQSGSIVNVPWRSHANQKQATIWAGYPGQRGGTAFGKLLLGDANFSGKMPMAWPKEDQMPEFRAAGTTTPMGYFFGYREYDRRKAAGQAVALEFPFGHGLSYSKFQYLGLHMPCLEATPKTIIDVQVDVANTSAVAGEEVVMLFVAPPPKPAGIMGDRPVKELKGFYKVALAPMGMDGSAKRVSIPVRVQDLRRWEGDASGSWVIDPGTYTIMVGPSGDDAALTLKDTFTIKG